MLRRQVILGGLLLLGLSAGQCHAWAIKGELRDPELLGATLTARVVKNRHLRYCLVMEEPYPQLPRNTVKLELLLALKLWTRAIGPCSFSEVTANQDWDLRVEVGRTRAGDRSHGAFCEQHREGVVIRINADFVWNETRSLPSNPNGTYRWHTLTSMIGGRPGGLESVVKDAEQRRLTLDQLAQELSQPQSALFYTVYRAFAHELGHGFGLADTNAEQFSLQSDERRKSSGAQPDSIMKTSSAMYLTADDLSGLKALVELVR